MRLFRLYYLDLWVTIYYISIIDLGGNTSTVYIGTNGILDEWICLTLTLSCTLDISHNQDEVKKCDQDILILITKFTSDLIIE